MQDLTQYRACRRARNPLGFDRGRACADRAARHGVFLASLAADHPPHSGPAAGLFLRHARVWTIQGAKRSGRFAWYAEPSSCRTTTTLGGEKTGCPCP